MKQSRELNYYLVSKPRPKEILDLALALNVKVNQAPKQ